MLLLQQLQPWQLTPCPVPRSRPRPSCSRRISTNLGLNFNPGFVFFFSIAFSSRSILFNYSILSRISTQKELNWIRLLPSYPLTLGFLNSALNSQPILIDGIFQLLPFQVRTTVLCPLLLRYMGNINRSTTQLLLWKRIIQASDLKNLRGKSPVIPEQEKQRDGMCPLGTCCVRTSFHQENVIQRPTTFIQLLIFSVRAAYQVRFNLNLRASSINLMIHFFFVSFLACFLPLFLPSYLYPFFAPSFVRSLVPSFLCSFFHSFIRSSVRSLIHSFIHSFLVRFKERF